MLQLASGIRGQSLQPGGGFYSKDSVDSWLVKVTPSNSITKVSYSVLTPGTPGPDDPCEISFPQAQAPWPPSPTAVSPTVRCGPMRVALNIAPAIAPDGTIYSIARSHAAFANRSGFLVAGGPGQIAYHLYRCDGRLVIIMGARKDEPKISIINLDMLRVELYNATAQQGSLGEMDSENSPQGLARP